MAASESFVYLRPNAAQDFMSFDRTNRGGIDYQTLEGTVPAAGAAIPQLAGAVVQEFTSADRFAETIVCSGTWLKIGETWGYLRRDAKAGTTAAYVFTGKVFVKLNAGLTIAAGEDAFIIAATGLFTNSSAGNEFVGKFLAAKETNPAGYPAGDFALIHLSQTQL